MPDDFNPDRLITEPRTLGDVYNREARSALITECCGMAIGPDRRFCPKCGWEARVLSSGFKLSRNEIKLYDRGDGVKGHFCIGRQIDDTIYHEFWHIDKFCSAGEVFIGREIAERRLREIQEWQALRQLLNIKEEMLENCEKECQEIKDHVPAPASIEGEADLAMEIWNGAVESNTRLESVIVVKSHFLKAARKILRRTAAAPNSSDVWEHAARKCDEVAKEFPGIRSGVAEHCAAVLRAAALKEGEGNG